MKVFALLGALLLILVAAYILSQRDENSGPALGAAPAMDLAADNLSASIDRACVTRLGPFGSDSYVASEVFALGGSPYFEDLNLSGSYKGDYAEGFFGLGPDSAEEYLEAVDKGTPQWGANLDVIWDHTIGLISFHWREGLDEDGNEVGGGFGLNLYVDDFALTEGDCYSHITSADFATADGTCCRPEDINIHTYVAPPGTNCELRVYSVSEDVLIGLIEGPCLKLQEVDVFSRGGGEVSIYGGFVAVGRSRLR